MADHQRRCDRCGQSLSRYNLSPTCGGCSTAARSNPDRQVMVPAAFWNDPRIRQALSQWRWSEVFQAVIAQTGTSQTQLAVAVGLSQAQISRLASGTSQCFDIRAINQIVDGLGAPRRLAGLAPAPVPGTVEDERPEEADPCIEEVFSPCQPPFLSRPSSATPKPR